MKNENEEPKHRLCVIMDCGIEMGGTGIEMGGTSVPCAMTFLGRGWKILRLLQCFFYHPSLLLIGKCMREVVDHGGWDVLFNVCVEKYIYVVKNSAQE